jgi:membrane protease subunit (stomatin/prohibitin family)
MRIRGLLFASLGALLLVAACKKTVEGEDQAWQRNAQRVNELAAVYPGFANALREQQQRAQAAMTAARAISDKEQSARKMAEANGLIDGGLVYSLGQLESRSKTLREKLVAANTAAVDTSDQAGARVAAEDAQRILRNVDDIIKAGAPSADAAAAVLRKIDGDLSSATANLDRVIAAARARKQEAAKTAAAASGTTAAPAGAVAHAQWKCTYCNHMNDESRKKCENCGAPQPTAQATPKPKKR